MEQDHRRFEKGRFTASRFAVATKYMRWTSRRRLFISGAIAAALLAVIFLADAFVGRAATVAGGPLSSGHALFGKDCSSCHTPLSGAPNTKCESCHNRYGNDRVYTFDTHYQYRSGDPDRSAPAGKEVACASCHREHQGRESLQNVADAQCSSCHTFGSFRKGHPEFDFAAEKIPDPANLKFTHVQHVREVMSEFGIDEVEASCVTCHVPTPTGETFKPISYAASCDGCHLSNESTPYVPLRGGGGPGVMTLGQIRASGEPGTQWADYWNAGDFNESGGTIQKRPVFHADPWVLYNMQQLRRTLYPGAELADLLRTSAETTPGQTGTLHREAVETLKAQLNALRGSTSPDVQREIASLTDLLKQIEERIDEPYAPLDETRFATRLADRAPGVADGTLNERAYLAVIDSLTAPCQSCHTVQNGTLRRVQTNQSALVRSEFNHGAHVIHARCLDCHAQIPIRDLVATDQDVAPNADHAGIQNLPTIATCRTCHAPRAAPTSCTSCHAFHPDKAHWSNMSRPAPKPK